MGLLKESIWYYQLGINVLHYSSLSDILSSPLVELTSHTIMIGAVLFCFLIIFIYIRIIIKNKNSKQVQKLLGVKKGEEPLTHEEVNRCIPFFALRFMAVMLLFFYVGIGLGKGKFAAKREKENRMKYKYAVTYSSGAKEDVFMIGNNSQYYF